MTNTPPTLPTDLRPVIAEALHAYELAQASHLREMSEQHRAAALVAAIDQTENAARTLLERAGLAHIIGAFENPEKKAAPVLRADQDIAAAFSAAHTAQVDLRTALLRLAAAYAGEEHWADVRRIVQPLLDDPQAPLYPDARDLLCLSHYAPALAALAAEDWVAARQGFEVILKLNSAYRDAAKQHRALVERAQREQRDATEHEVARIPVTIAEWQRELGQHNQQFGKPAGYFCYVRPGTYRIGGWGKLHRSANVTLPAFWLARFPVTVAQYAPFDAAGYGPDTYHWWTQEGWGWKGNRTVPYEWGKPEYSGPNQPVVGVTWYEATAFCAWLTAQMGDELPSGHELRLPSEAEWEAAAAFDAQMQRQPYPWGAAALDLDRAIYGATRPAPVGCCPAGAAACGAMDLIGNVWESMASSYAAYPSQSAVLRKDFTPQESDVPWRGGAWNDNGTNVRCGARGGNVLGNVDVGGFRVVLAPRLRE
ncbi:MAG: SUMF1/EgtB/PvdO family nonheme iron enzyme [Chloroflexales bacterium]